MNRKLRKLIKRPDLFLLDAARNAVGRVVPAARPGRRTAGHYRYSVISAVYGVEHYLEEFLKSLVEQSLDFQRHVQVVLVDDGSPDGSAAVIERWRRRYPDNIVYIRKENGGQASARNLGLDHATGDWATFIDPDDFVDRRYFEHVDRFLASDRGRDVVLVSCAFIFYHEDKKRFSNDHPLSYRFAKGTQVRPAGQLGKLMHLTANSGFFQLQALKASGLRFDERIRPSFEDVHFAGRYQAMFAGAGSIAFLPAAKYYYRKRSDGNSTLDTAWEKPGLFGEVLEHGCLDLLREVTPEGGPAPQWAQRTVLYHLMWYFRKIVNNPAAVSVLDDAGRERFKHLLQRIFSYIEARTILEFELAGCWFYHKVGLLGLFGKEPPARQIVYVDDFDAIRGQVRLRYFHHAEQPFESFVINGRDADPAHAKTRVHDFLGERFVSERIVWLPLDADGTLRATLGSGAASLSLGGKQHEQLTRKQIAAALGRVARPAAGAMPPHVKALRALARRPWARKHFGGAWAFIDRDVLADDNAEHLYRYVARNHPNINAFFILRRDSKDWDRLASEGFRLVPFGSLRHRLLLLNASHLVSSQADAFVVSFLPERWYKDMLSYRFTFLQHGVTKDDLSAWLNNKKIDVFVTSSPREYQSIVENNSPYKFTDKEVVLTGQPRYDALLAGQEPAQRRTLLVMPTWRQSIAGKSTRNSYVRIANPAFAESEYALRWKSILHSPILEALATKHGLRVVFYPHAAVQQYLDCFCPPSHVEIPSASDGTSIQALFREAALMLTDYSSVAFEMAMLEKPVVYYQFDREHVFGGGHSTRKGYYDYDEDGFGPVAFDEDGVLREIEAILSAGGRPAEEHARRMRATFAYRDRNNCQRTYHAIAALDRARADGSGTAPALLDRARQASMQGRWAVARERWTRYLALQGRQAAAPAGTLEEARAMLEAAERRLTHRGEINRRIDVLAASKADLGEALFVSAAELIVDEIRELSRLAQPADVDPLRIKVARLLRGAGRPDLAEAVLLEVQDSTPVVAAQRVADLAEVYFSRQAWALLGALDASRLAALPEAARKRPARLVAVAPILAAVGGRTPDMLENQAEPAGDADTPTDAHADVDASTAGSCRINFELAA